MPDYNPDIDLLYIHSKAAHKSRRKRLLAKLGGVCVFCDAPNATTLDHMIPRSKGGSEDDANLWPCCPRCNNQKASKDWREYFRNHPNYNRDREALISEWVM
jgi:5-methylcytosine-specific restriction endonuclease McrA